VLHYAFNTTYTRGFKQEQHHETKGAFVISEEAIASFSPLGVAYLFKRKTIDGIQKL